MESITVVPVFMEMNRKKVIQTILDNVKYGMKCSAILYVLFKRMTINYEQTHPGYFHTTNIIILLSVNIAKWLNNQLPALTTAVENMQNARGFGWSIKRIVCLEIRINKYNPLKCGLYIWLPPSIVAKKAVINVENEDDHCFERNNI